MTPFELLNVLGHYGQCEFSNLILVDSDHQGVAVVKHGPSFAGYIGRRFYKR